MKKSIHFLLLHLAVWACNSPDPEAKLMPEPSGKPNTAQRAQIDRKYGMFIHFGINTFHDMEWTDGSLPPESYAPVAIDAEQWIETASRAGMKYVILVAKHHDGFCLWDSELTGYDVAASSNPADVVEAAAKACAKQGIGLGLYYSLWDRNRNADVADSTLDAAYNRYMLGQINELIDIAGRHTPVVEFWFDGGWTKPNHRWPVEALYKAIKMRLPDCQVGVNWSIGRPDNPDHHPVLPEEQQEGFPIRYFPSDFRLGDPYLPAEPDPKIFTHGGKNYYMPFESTVCMSGKWFYHSADTVYKTLDELEILYRRATAQDNILILNSPPNREGRLRQADVELLVALRGRLGI
jgi:alpha-L-fucosidase